MVNFDIAICCTVFTPEIAVKLACKQPYMSYCKQVFALVTQCSSMHLNSHYPIIERLVRSNIIISGRILLWCATIIVARAYMGKLMELHFILVICKPSHAPFLHCSKRIRINYVQSRCWDPLANQQEMQADFPRRITRNWKQTQALRLGSSCNAFKDFTTTKPWCPIFRTSGFFIAAA